MQKLLQLPTTNQLQLYEFQDENFETSIVIGFYQCKKLFLDFPEMANKEADALHKFYLFDMKDLSISI